MPKKPVILCVDDEKIVLNGLKEQLTRTFNREYSIECAESGQIALEIFQELCEEGAEVPVIISDHIMPGMKGDELLKEIYQLNPRIRKILLTGQADADAVGRAVNNANLYRYLSKPWDQGDLILTVQEAIRSYFQDKTLEQQNELLTEANSQLEILNEKLKQKVILFNKFVPTQFLEAIHIDIEKRATEKAASMTESEKDHVELAQSAELQLTVMFADIRSFTQLCENFTCSQAFQFVNDYLSIMGPVITNNKGFIDKFIGDAIMSIFNNADDALKAAINMHLRLNMFNDNLAAKGQKPIAIGTGLNSGTIMLGTVGDANRLQTTIIGDAVNLSARTEKLTKEFGAPLIITGNTFDKLSDPSQFNIRFIDRLRVRGKQQLMDFYEVMDALPAELQAKKKKISKTYKDGVLAYLNGEYEKAKHFFEECLKEFPDDYASQQYVIKCNEKINHETVKS